MGQAIQFYETYGGEILGAMLVMVAALLVVQMVRLKKLREEMAQLARQLREEIVYVPHDRTTAAEDPFRGFTQEENRQRKEQLVKEMKEKEQNELISSVLEEIFP